MEYNLCTSRTKVVPILNFWKLLSWHEMFQTWYYLSQLFVFVIVDNWISIKIKTKSQWVYTNLTSSNLRTNTEDLWYFIEVIFQYVCDVCISLSIPTFSALSVIPLIQLVCHNVNVCFKSKWRQRILIDIYLLRK